MSATVQAKARAIPHCAKKYFICPKISVFQYVRVLNEIKTFWLRVWLTLWLLWVDRWESFCAYYADLSWHLCGQVKMCDITFCGVSAYQRFNEPDWPLPRATLDSSFFPWEWMMPFDYWVVALTPYFLLAERTEFIALGHWLPYSC